MNIIELVKSLLQQFPKINEVCNEIHVDFTDDIPTNYGLSSVGDTLLQEDILGNRTRQHNFILYAVYQSQSDYDRMINSGALLELSYWLEKQANQQPISCEIDGVTYSGELEKLSCANGMIFNIPSGNLNDGIQYQLQISARYKLNV